MRTFLVPLARIAACLLVASPAAAAQITISPAAPQMLDPVRVQIPRIYAALYDMRSVRVVLADGKFTVYLKSGPLFDPVPPPSLLDVLLGQLPVGSYTVEAVLDDAAPVTIGTASFTVAPRKSPLPVYSDLWWSPDESGWGINIIHHPSGAIFATLFIYQPPGAGVGPPRWYVVPTGTWSDSFHFTGPLYATTGPVLGDTFDASKVTRTAVGTATITFLSQDAAKLTVETGQGLVFKSLRRQPF